jgi:hypothetical protein
MSDLFLQVSDSAAAMSEALDRGSKIRHSGRDLLVLRALGQYGHIDA